MTGKICTVEELTAHIDRMAAGSIAIGRDCAETLYLDEGCRPLDVDEVGDLKEGFRRGSSIMFDRLFVCGDGEKLPEDFRKVIVDFLTMSAADAFLRRFIQIARADAVSAVASDRAGLPS